MKNFNMKNLMKMQKELQQKMEKMQEEMGKKTVEGSSGGGMVTIKMNGHQEVLGVTIDPSVVDPEDIEMLEDLVLAAFNAALARSKEMAQEEMGQLTNGFNIPGLPF